MRGGRGSQTFFAAAGDIQAKPTPVSGGLDLLVHTFCAHCSNDIGYGNHHGVQYLGTVDRYDRYVDQ